MKRSQLKAGPIGVGSQQLKNLTTIVLTIDVQKKINNFFNFVE